MDRLQYKIPKRLLDQFVDYSISNKLFDDPKKFENKNVNKYEKYEANNDPDYLYYQKRRQHYMERNDIFQLFSNLKIDSKPFYPKKNDESLKNLLNDYDTSNIKEYVPKNLQGNQNK